VLLSDTLELNSLGGPSRPALVAGERSYSFGDLPDRSRRLDVALSELAAPGARIAILAESIGPSPRRRWSASPTPRGARRQADRRPDGPVILDGIGVAPHRIAVDRSCSVE
jgi:hypothetical protein